MSTPATKKTNCPLKMLPNIPNVKLAIKENVGTLSEMDEPQTEDERRAFVQGRAGKIGWLSRNRSNRAARRAKAASNRRKEAALKRLYAVLRLTERMDKFEVKSEAYFALKLGMITKDQARELGCVVK